MRYRLGVPQHAVGHRVVVTDHAVGKLVNKGIAVEGEVGDAVVDRRLEQLRAVVLLHRPAIAVETVGDPVLGRHAAEVPVLPHALDSASAKRPSTKKASRGVVAIQLGLPRPALSMARAGHPAPRGDVDQPVLDLERADAFERSLRPAAHMPS